VPELQTPFPETSQQPPQVEALHIGAILQALVSASQTCPDGHAMQAAPPEPQATVSTPRRQRDVPASQQPVHVVGVQGG